MKTPGPPQNFQEWQHCIVVDCGIRLTPEFITERLSALNDSSNYSTQKFIELYGEPYLKVVIGWFLQAQKLM